MTKAIIFDYFGVISSDGYWDLVKADKNLQGDFQDLSREVNLGRMQWHDFVAEIARRTGQSADVVRSMYEAQRIHPELVAYVHELHKTYKTALLTNANAGFLQPIIDRAHLREVFDEVVMSSQVGYAKPDQRIYQAVLERLGVTAEEAVFVDDAAVNTEAAQDLGMAAIIYESLPQLRQALQKCLTIGE